MSDYLDKEKATSLEVLRDSENRRLSAIIGAIRFFDYYASDGVNNLVKVVFPADYDIDRLCDIEDLCGSNLRDFRCYEYIYDCLELEHTVSIEFNLIGKVDKLRRLASMRYEAHKVYPKVVSAFYVELAITELFWYVRDNIAELGEENAKNAVKAYVALLEDIS